MALNKHSATSVIRLWIGMLLMFGIVSPTADAQSLLQQEQAAIQQAVAAVSPSIVRIETVGGTDLVGKLLTGTGPTSGVIVTEDGYIITSSFNFVADPASVLVTVVNGAENQKFAAQIIASDESKMLTLLKIEASGLRPLQAASKSTMRVGQRSIALGRTFQLDFPNISTGIISALNRVNGKAIQTDAKTSPVNYGGPLINLAGECLGIIVPLSPQGEGVSAGVEWYDSGIGFAIPLEEVNRVLDRMMSGEDLVPGLMGVSFAALGPLAGEAKILRVRPTSPADEAGLQIDDVITSIDGQAVERLINLKQILGNRYAGDSVKVTIARGEKSFTKEIELVGELLAYEFGTLGILPNREPQNAASTGIVVRYVLDGLGAAEAGIQKGDRLVEIDGEPVSSSSQLHTLLTTKSIDDQLSVKLIRGETEQTIQVPFKSFPHGDAVTNIPPVVIPAGDIPEGVKTGRFNQQLPGSDRSFWVYVPENYNPDFAYGMLTWIHPPSDTQEADMLRFWSDLCNERGIIFVGPRAEDLSGWSAGDVAFVNDVTDWVAENYTVDASRMAIMGTEEGGAFATQLAFTNREKFRGLIAFESPLRAPPPDSAPDQRLLIAMVGAPETRQRPQIDKSVEVLRDRKFPTALLDSEEEAKFSFDLVNNLIQWLDMLDQL